MWGEWRGGEGSRSLVLRSMALVPRNATSFFPLFCAGNGDRIHRPTLMRPWLIVDFSLACGVMVTLTLGQQYGCCLKSYVKCLAGNYVHALCSVVVLQTSSVSSLGPNGKITRRVHSHAVHPIADCTAAVHTVGARTNHRTTAVRNWWFLLEV